MTALPYPSHIRPLTSLRFVAAIWVLLYHFKDHLGFDLGRIGLVGDGYLGVDLFFTLSGFILAHVYLSEIESGRFHYFDFLRNRLARIYPLHLVGLGAMLALFFGAVAAGVSVGQPDAFKLKDIPAHLALVHAWGATMAVGWNFPSWSISAEWAAYLQFPVIAFIVLKTNQPRFMLLWSLALCLFSFVALDQLHQLFRHVGREYAQMTAQIGALRIMPSFFMGVSLYAFGRRFAAPARAAWPIALASLFWIIFVATTGLWDGLVWFGFAGLIYGLAETARHGADAPAAGPRFVFLGAASYALYMLHLPVDIVWFHAMERLGVDENAPVLMRAAVWIGVFIASVGVSALAYVWVEEPARRWVRNVRLPAPSSQAQSARSQA
ncbi:MAG TPA: acyltransferase [Caulobacterales bacterium]|nr:acyltransferase [Caulobacterales bacterium]